MAWDDDKTVGGASVSGSEWNTMAAVINAKLDNIVEDTTPQLGGNLDLNSKGFFIANQSVGGSTGDLVMFNGSSWIQADASASSTCDSLLGINLGSSNVLTYGLYAKTGFTAGNVLYVGETAGSIVETAPSTSGANVRVIGYALTASVIMVSPDGTYIEVA